MFKNSRFVVQSVPLSELGANLSHVGILRETTSMGHGGRQRAKSEKHGAWSSELMAHLAAIATASLPLFEAFPVSSSEMFSASKIFYQKNLNNMHQTEGLRLLIDPVIVLFTLPSSSKTKPGDEPGLYQIIIINEASSFFIFLFFRFRG